MSESFLYWKWYYRRVALARFLGLWSHRWLMTRREIIQHNADGYDNARGKAGVAVSEPRTFLDGRVTLYAADCRDVLREMADNSVDSVVTDPPYHLTSSNGTRSNLEQPSNKDCSRINAPAFRSLARGFMGKQWDGGDIAFQTALWTEVLRVLKPGGYIMAFSSCRTYHRMACAIEDAGFVTHPFFAWAFGSGFPKAHNVSKQIDKRGGKPISWFGPWLRKWCEEKGVTQKQIAALFPSKTGRLTGCVANWELGFNLPTNDEFNLICETFGLPFDNMEEAKREIIGKINGNVLAVAPGQNNDRSATILDITAPATDAAREWDGWFYGTQSCKPAVEPVYFGQKPFERGLNGAQNVLKWGVGAINVGACKIPSGDLDADRTRHGGGIVGNGTSYEFGRDKGGALGASRWPANMIHDGSDEVLACFPETTSGEFTKRKTSYRGDDGGSWNNVPTDCDVNGSNGGDSGSAARFFKSFPQESYEEIVQLVDSVKRLIYMSKADADDRLGSKHPTVKPLDLIQYLVRLITPPKGVCVDLFAGTGTTAEACFREGFRAILIENDPESIADIERRMSLVMAGPDTRAYASAKARNRPRDDGPLFGGVASE